MADERPVVLVAEDERNLADLYGQWLAERYTVRTADDGVEALAAMDDTVDVVLLDRRMPGLSGDEFLSRIRDQGFDAQVAVVSAVEPAVDVIEMGFDDYVVKPVSHDDLINVVERMVSVGGSDPSVREYFSLLAKRDLLEDRLAEADLGGGQEYDRLIAAISRFEEWVVSLAERCVEGYQDTLSLDDRRVFTERLRDLEEQQAGMAETDPLYGVIDAEIQHVKELLGQPDDGRAKRQLLELVRDSFVADGVWLDPAVRRALNILFLGKDHDLLVIDRQQLQPGVELSDRQLLAVSQSVRALAKAELRRLEANPVR